ncbi:MAG: hypothetical protein WCE94_00380 [Candidatus Methanoperedens sp.]
MTYKLGEYEKSNNPSKSIALISCNHRQYGKTRHWRRLTGVWGRNPGAVML